MSIRKLKKLKANYRISKKVGFRMRNFHKIIRELVKFSQILSLGRISRSSEWMVIALSTLRTQDEIEIWAYLWANSGVKKSNAFYFNLRILSSIKGSPKSNLKITSRILSLTTAILLTRMTKKLFIFHELMTLKQSRKLHRSIFKLKTKLWAGVFRTSFPESVLIWNSHI